MTDAERPNFVPVRPGQPPKPRRWWQRVPLGALVWLAGTVGITVWWAARPGTGVLHVVLMVPTAGVLLAAGLIPRGRP